MNVSKIVILLIFIPLLSCGQKKQKSEAGALTEKASYLLRYNSIDSNQKAVSMLDEATTIDNDYYLAWYYERMYYTLLGKYRQAIEAGNNCVRLEPDDYNSYLGNGLIYALLKEADSSKVAFQKVLSICNARLDTMSENNKNYFTVGLDKGISLVMLGDSLKGNTVFKSLYDLRTNDSLQDSINQEGLKTMFMNKDKQQLLEQWYQQLNQGEQHLESPPPPAMNK